MSFSVVPRLEEMAFVVSLENIVSKLVACNDYNPGEKRPVEAVHSFNNFLDSMAMKRVINGIRNSLSYHLIGRVGVKVRQQYLNYYFHEEFLSKYHQNIPQPWMILDSVLDESFKKLDQPVPLNKDLNENDLNVIPTIAHRSSKLEELEICFEYSKHPIMQTLEKFGHVIQSLSSLRHLTSLTLIHLPECRRSVLKFVGKSCLLLSTFRLMGSIEATNRDFVALILGERAHELFPIDSYDYDYISKDDKLKLENMVVPNEMLTPICSTLQNLYLTEEEDDDIESGLVFALRHLPKSREVGGTYSLPAAIKILYDSLRAKSVGEQAAIGSQCNFSGMTLSLTVIEEIYVVPMEEESFRLIGEKCPHLKEVSFNQKQYTESPNRIQISLLYLENVLKNGWPKLHSIIFVSVAPEFVRLILKIFGPSLQHLTFQDCDDVDLSNLLPCTRLKSVSITSSSLTTNLKGIPSPDLSANEFLPQLETIEVDTCLGHWSRLFEENSGLKCASFACCHIGTPANIYPDCNSIPDIWPHLEKLLISTKCSDKGFTMPMISAMISRLPNLKEICLPSRFKPSC